MKSYTTEELALLRKIQLRKQDESNELGTCEYTVEAEMFVAQAAKDFLSRDGGTSDYATTQVTNLFKVALEYSELTPDEFTEFIRQCMTEAGMPLSLP